MFQSILRGKGISQKSERKKKSVTFTEGLTEIIGYGGDDFFSDGEEEEEEEDEQDTADSLNGDDEIPPDSEEERALGNLTRANTNFNTVTANLTEIVAANESSKSTGKSFASLMLGRIQKDSEGKKTTLLVSVTPFGGDESLPTARRPADKKVNGFVNGFANFSKCKATVDNEKAEVGIEFLFPFFFFRNKFLSSYKAWNNIERLDFFSSQIVAMIEILFSKFSSFVGMGNEISWSEDEIDFSLYRITRLFLFVDDNYIIVETSYRL